MTTMTFPVSPGYFNLIAGILCILLMPASAAQNVVKLAAIEQVPYIGKNLPHQGYVNELVTTAFERAGYATEVSILPLLRAKTLTQQGSYDGLIPLHYDTSQTSHFYFSRPFPGDNAGLLKKKHLRVNSYEPRLDLNALIVELKDYSIGQVHGTSLNPMFEAATFINKHLVSRELQLLDMLSAGRIDVAIIDQYTAADLMINQRPHLLGQLEFLRPPLASKDFHVAFSKITAYAEQLTRAFNQGLSDLERDGTLDTILARHGLLPSKKRNADKKILTIGAIDTEEIRVMKGLSEDFEKQNPNLELEWRIMDENTLRKRLLADIAISEGNFDIMMIGAYEAPIWGRNGWLRPITNLPASFAVEDMSQSALKGLSYQGELFALPFYVESTMTFYRKDLFDEAGIDMPDNPSYHEILELAKHVHNPDNGIYGIGLRGKAGWGQNMAFVTILVNTFGGRWFDEHWRPTINSKAWREALRYYKNILSRYGPPDYAENGWYENQRLFAEGKLAIVVDATSFAGRLFNPKHSKVHDKMGIAAAPVGRYAKGSRWLWSWSLAIPESTKFPQQAQAFITWATSKEYIRRVAETEGWVAVPPGSRVSTYGDEYRAKAPFADFVIQEIQKVNPQDFTAQAVPYSGPQFVAIPEFPAIGNQVGLKIEQYLRGTLSLDETLESSQDLTEQILRKSGYYDKR